MGQVDFVGGGGSFLFMIRGSSLFVIPWGWFCGSWVFAVGRVWLGYDGFVSMAGF